MATRYISSRLADRCSRMKVSANQLAMAMKQFCSDSIDIRKQNQKLLTAETWRQLCFLVNCQNTGTHLVKLGLSRVNRTSGHPRSHFRTQWCVKVCFGLRLRLIPRVEKEQRRDVVFFEFEHMCNV